MTEWKKCEQELPPYKTKCIVFRFILKKYLILKREELTIHPDDNDGVEGKEDSWVSEWSSCFKIDPKDAWHPILPYTTTVTFD